MRILQVNKFLYRRGGAEAYMLDLAEKQQARGDIVEFFGMDHPDNDHGETLRETFPANVELDPAPRGGKRLVASGRMFWSVAGQRGMSRALRILDPDVVHCHNVYHQLSPSILVPVQRASIPCVMTLHDYKLACPSYQLLDHEALCDACVGGSTWNAARRRCKGGSLGASTLLAAESGLHRLAGAYDRVDVFISPSRFLAEVMQRAGIPADRIRVVPNYASLDGVQAATAPGSGLLYFGRLSAEKGIDVLIEAVARMDEATHLSLAGDGPARASLEQLAARAAPGRVTFHGRLGKTEVHQLLTRSAISVVPSRWHENQPMTILESFGAAVPVVVTDLGGMPELVRDHVDGLVVPPNDVEALATALTGLLADPARRRDMGRRGREKVLADFDLQRHLTKVDEVYAEARERVRERAGRRSPGRPVQAGSLL